MHGRAGRGIRFHRDPVAAVEEHRDLLAPRQGDGPAAHRVEDGDGIEMLPPDLPPEVLQRAIQRGGILGREQRLGIHDEGLDLAVREIPAQGAILGGNEPGRPPMGRNQMPGEVEGAQRRVIGQQAAHDQEQPARPARGQGGQGKVGYGRT